MDREPRGEDEHVGVIKICLSPFSLLTEFFLTFAPQRTLIEHGVDEITINRIEYMLENRTIYANMYGEEVSKNPESGAPRGGILSAKALWNTVMYS